MRTSLKPLIAAATLGVVVAMNPMTSAFAEEAPPSSVPTPAGLAPGEEVTVPGSEIADAREDVASGDIAVPQAQADAITDELVSESAEKGIYLDDDSIDVVPLLDGDAVLALPTDVDVDFMTVSLSEDGVMSADLQASESDASNVDLAGPEMAASWTANGSGSYILKIISNGKVMADGNFTWKRYKYDAGGVTNYLYKRFGDIQPTALNNQPDPRVQILRIQSFPYDSVEPNLINWNKYSPASDRSDDCSDYTASFTLFGVGVSVPFSAGCGKYNMWRNVDKPSSYWLQYEGGGYGNREVGYVLSWSQKKGTAGSMHDLQQIVIDFRFPSPYPTMACTQTDASRNCTGA